MESEVDSPIQMLNLQRYKPVARCLYRHGHRRRSPKAAISFGRTRLRFPAIAMEDESYVLSDGRKVGRIKRDA